MSDIFRIGVIDEQPLFRDGIAIRLQSEPSFQLVGQGSTPRDALRMASELVPDLMILDLVGSVGGLAALEGLCVNHPSVKILVLTTEANEQQVCTALKLGARGYLLKSATGAELLKAVRLLLEGECYVAPTLAAKLLTGFGQKTTSEKKRDRFSELSYREEQILVRLKEDLSNKEIGNKLDLSEKTVKHYVIPVQRIADSGLRRRAWRDSLRSGCAVDGGHHGRAPYLSGLLSSRLAPARCS